MTEPTDGLVRRLTDEAKTTLRVKSRADWHVVAQTVMTCEQWLSIADRIAALQDEVERLTGEVVHLRKVGALLETRCLGAEGVRDDLHDRIAALQDEVERLTDQRDQLRAVHQVNLAEERALKARISKLEAGLREIAGADPIDLALDPEQPQRIARSLLAPASLPREEPGAWLYEILDHKEVSLIRCPERISWKETPLFASLPRGGEERAGQDQTGIKLGRDPSGQATREPRPAVSALTGECPSRDGGAS